MHHQKFIHSEKTLIFGVECDANLKMNFLLHLNWKKTVLYGLATIWPDTSWCVFYVTTGTRHCAREIWFPLRTRYPNYNGIKECISNAFSFKNNFCNIIVHELVGVTILHVVPVLSLELWRWLKRNHLGRFVRKYLYYYKGTRDRRASVRVWFLLHFFDVSIWDVVCCPRKIGRL